MLTLPLVPDTDSPVRIETDPLLPLLLEPVFKERLPLAPSSPALAVTTLNDPLLVVLPYPVDMEIDPPVELVL
jgi:hypothetical protein